MKLTIVTTASVKFSIQCRNAESASSAEHWLDFQPGVCRRIISLDRVKNAESIVTTESVNEASEG
jgi:hypothetical protein